MPSIVTDSPDATVDGIILSLGVVKVNEALWPSAVILYCPGGIPWVSMVMRNLPDAPVMTSSVIVRSIYTASAFSLASAVPRNVILYLPGGIFDVEFISVVWFCSS